MRERRDAPAPTLCRSLRLRQNAMPHSSGSFAIPALGVPSHAQSRLGKAEGQLLHSRRASPAAMALRDRRSDRQRLDRSQDQLPEDQFDTAASTRALNVSRKPTNTRGAQRRRSTSTTIAFATGRRRGAVAADAHSTTSLPSTAGYAPYLSNQTIATPTATCSAVHGRIPMAAIATRLFAGSISARKMKRAERAFFGHRCGARLAGR